MCLRHAELTALLGCPDAAGEVLYPVLRSSTHFCPPPALVLLLCPSQPEAPSCLQDSSEVK